MSPDQSVVLESWIGRERSEEDVLTLAPSRALSATLDRSAGSLGFGATLPPGWHWIYFTPHARRSHLGRDGHEKRGDFLPPVALPRRMWAGGRLHFSGPLHIGESVRRVSTIESVAEKRGRSGPLVFVTVGHRISGAAGLAVEEQQHLVYRSGGGPASRATPLAPPGTPAWSELFTADVVTLFRFSALTFNGHRIHYDHRYATGVEGYPNLVVHGPLTALLLLDAAGRWTGRAVRSFTYRAVGALYADEEFTIAGRETETGVLELWATHPKRGVAMSATAETAP